ncbi:MAG: pyridoxamine 5'-phosphate oxidase family protein, partial [Candidatus Mcinerneyibacterium aminivorans]
MFKKMRRIDKKMKKEKAIKILKNSEYGVLSTIGENKYCYGVPLNYVVMENSIYFHSAKEGHKIDNLKFNKKVSFCVVKNQKPIPEKLTTAYESVVVFGKAEFVEGEEKRDALMALTKKFAPNHMEKGKESIKKEFD